MNIGIELVVVPPMGTPFAVLTADGVPVAVMNHYYYFITEYRVFYSEEGKGSHELPKIFGEIPCSWTLVQKSEEMTEEEWRDWEIRTLFEHAGLEIDEVVVKRLVEEARGWVYDYIYL